MRPREALWLNGAYFKLIAVGAADLDKLKGCETYFWITISGLNFASLNETLASSVYSSSHSAFCFSGCDNNVLNVIITIRSKILPTDEKNGASSATV